MPEKKQLSLFDLSMIVVSLVIGMGIFRTPVNVAEKAQTPEFFYLAWIIGGLIAFCGALTYAEIGSRFPVTGGYYKILSACYHPSVAFSINCIMVLTNTAALAGVTLIGSEYLSSVIFPKEMQTDVYRLIIAASTIILFYIVNLFGLKASSKTQNVLTVVKVVMIFVLICSMFAGSYAAPVVSVFTSPTGAAPTWSDYGKAIGLCLVAVTFTFSGYTQTINFGGEVKDAKNVVPKAIMIGLLTIIGIYLLLNYAYVKVIGFEQLKSAENIAAILAGTIFGPAGYTMLSGIIFLSVMGYVNVNLLSNPRAMYAMGEEKALPGIFAQRNKKTDVMVISLTTFAALTLLTLFFAKTFDTVLNYAIILECIGTACSAATLFFLRKRNVNLNQSSIYTMKLYPYVPILFIAVYTFVGVSVFRDDPVSAGNGLILFVAFIGLYFLGKIGQRKKTV